jgi:hypothetical protein
MLVSVWGTAAAADWKSDVGFTRLQSELGAQTPTGAGVQVTQVEAGDSYYLPNTGLTAEFGGKTFIQKSTPAYVSSHATTVAQYFYGTQSSIAPGIATIENYNSANWKGIGFLQYGYALSPPTSSRVANHSWIGSSLDPQILAGVDWVVNRDEYIQVVAMGSPQLANAFNVISVGLSAGRPGNTSAMSAPYSAGRARPDLVAPGAALSWATPMVASATALLVEEGHRSGNTLSTDPAVKFTTNRNGNVIYNSERSEVVKAALMGGANRRSANFASAYTVNSSNGLNTSYGAGELNVYNSYHLIKAGEQNSREDCQAGGGEILARGFDYDPSFGGASQSNKVATYVFKALTTGDLAASLVWNLNVSSLTNTGFSASLYNLDLALYDTTANQLVGQSTSTIDNTENLWYTSLTPNHSYLLQVTTAPGQADFLWDYGLAWNITATTTHAPLPPSAYLLGSGMAAMILWHRRTRRRGSPDAVAPAPPAELP